MNYHNPTLRVLKILELIDKSTDGISLSEIAASLEMPQGTISPILKTLLAFHYIRQTGNLYRIDFASIAEDFHLIDSMRFGVVIPDQDIKGILAMDKIPFEARRKLQRRSASVTFYELKALIGEGAIECKENGLYVLTDSSRYDRRTGLKVKDEAGRALFA